MPIHIPLTHPTLMLKPKIQEISENFLRVFGFNYFQYLRCFSDGSIGLLTNHTGLIEYFEQIDNSPVVFSSFDEQYENMHSYWFLWDEALPDVPVTIAREKFNFRSGVTLVRRTKHYYDMIAVALPYELANPGTFYLNKIKAIEEFIQIFDHDNNELIKIMNNHPIVLPEPYRDVNYKNICLTKGKITVPGKNGMTYITAQELTCLRLWLQGASYKEMAQLLGLSPRTIETYLSRMRQRTGFSSRIDMARMMVICPS